jgi:predicted Na+-dependent transporter
MIIARLSIPHWQFSEKDTVPIMFCGATKTLAMGIPLINALYGNKHQDMSGVLSLPLQEIVNISIFFIDFRSFRVNSSTKSEYFF